MTERPLDVWVLDDDEAIRWVLRKALEGAGMRCRDFGNGGEFRNALYWSRMCVCRMWTGSSCSVS
jgi:two-component system nitrogen regulation response regulator GlnG